MSTYHIQQKITAVVNQYRIFEDADGQAGKLVAFAHQKRVALKEKIIFYADEAMRQELFYLQARQIVDIGGTYDVHDAGGELLGTLSKQFKKSLLRSTWHILQPNRDETFLIVHERNAQLALLRRIWEFTPFINILPFLWTYHFDFYDPVLQTVPATYDKKTVIRDYYRLHADDDLLENIDWRVLVAQGVALDALQRR